MKKLLFTLIFLLTTSLQAQVYYPYNDYIPFPDSDAVWRVGLWGSRCFGPVTYPGVIEYYINGDTIINGLSYVKLYRRTIQQGTLPSYAPQILNGYVGAVRNDTANKTVWFFPVIGTNEMVLWDLSWIQKNNNEVVRTHFPYTDMLGEVDTDRPYGGVYSCISYFTGPSIPLQDYLLYYTDSLTILGNVHRRYHFRMLWGFVDRRVDAIIEGIGFQRGLLEILTDHGSWDSLWQVGHNSSVDFDICWPPEAYPGQSQLLCFTQNGQSYEFVPGGCANPQAPQQATGTYVPFPGDGAKWRIKMNNSIYEYRLSGSTIIQGKQYWKVYRTRVSGYVPPTYLPSVPTGYIGAVRDDSLDRKVYFFPAQDTMERLLYDFSLQDTGYFVWNYFQSNCYEDFYNNPPTLCPPWIAGIDSVNILGVWRKRWKLETRVSDTSVIVPYSSIYGDTLFYKFSKKHSYAIEGLGVLERPFEFWMHQSYFWGWDWISGILNIGLQTCGDSVNFQFVCFEWNGQSYIADTAACYQPVGLSFEETAEIKTYFQRERLIVEAMEGIPLQEIKVFNLLGQEIPLEFRSISGDKQEAEAFLLPTGIYIVKVQTAQGMITEKVWKKH